MKKLLLVIFTFLCVIFWYTFAQSSGTSIVTGETITSSITENSGNQYQTAKTEIISILPSNLWIDVEWLFQKFESIASDTTQTGDIQQDKRKESLQDIINLIIQNLATGEETQVNQVAILDMDNIIIPNVCKIATSYDITSELCNNSISNTETGYNLYYIVLVSIIIAIFCGSWLLRYRTTRKAKRGNIFLAIIWIIIISLVVFFIYNGDIIIDFERIGLAIWWIVGLFIWLIIRKYLLTKKIKWGEEQKQKFLNMINSSKEALEKQEYEKALNICNEAIKIYENIWIPNYDKEEFYVKILEYQKSLQKTLSLLNKSLTLDKKDKDSFINVWETLFFLWRNEEAIKTYKEAIELYKEDKNLYAALWGHLVNIWKYEEGLKILKEAIKRDSSFKDAYFNVGVALNKLWRNEEAIKMYDTVIWIDKYYISAYINKWGTLSELWRNEEALETYNEAIRSNKYNGTIYFNKWVILSNLWRNEDALQTYNEALKISPFDKKIYLNKWIILWKLKKNKEALECFDYLITKIDPSYSVALYAKACLYSLMNKNQEAIKSLNIAIQMDITWKEKAKTDEDFENIRNLSEFKKIIWE